MSFATKFECPIGAARQGDARRPFSASRAFSLQGELDSRWPHKPVSARSIRASATTFSVTGIVAVRRASNAETGVRSSCDAPFIGKLAESNIATAGRDRNAVRADGRAYVSGANPLLAASAFYEHLTHETGNGAARGCAMTGERVQTCAQSDANVNGLGVGASSPADPAINLRVPGHHRKLSSIGELLPCGHCRMSVAFAQPTQGYNIIGGGIVLRLIGPVLGMPVPGQARSHQRPVARCNAASDQLSMRPSRYGSRLQDTYSVDTRRIEGSTPSMLSTFTTTTMPLWAIGEAPSMRRSVPFVMAVPAAAQGAMNPPRPMRVRVVARGCHTFTSTSRVQCRRVLDSLARLQVGGGVKSLNATHR